MQIDALGCVKSIKGPYRPATESTAPTTYKPSSLLRSDPRKILESRQRLRLCFGLSAASKANIPSAPPVASVMQVSMSLV
jgi:hypothetical protein